MTRHARIAPIARAPPKKSSRASELIDPGRCGRALRIPRRDLQPSQNPASEFMAGVASPRIRGYETAPIGTAGSRDRRGRKAGRNDVAELSLRSEGRKEIGCEEFDVDALSSAHPVRGRA